MTQVLESSLRIHLLPKEAGSSAIATIAFRFMPLLTGCFLAAYIDRVNVSFAALTANRDLGLSSSEFGWGAGLFFLGYFLAETPSNVMLTKVGPRRWFARIMITMGLVAAATSMVVGPRSFYVARFLLGTCEAGLLPGVIWFFRQWIPKQYRAQYMAVFLLAIPLASVIGAPLSGAIMQLDGLYGFKGWQLMYVIEALPCLVLGVLLLIFLTEKRADATWLDGTQKSWLDAQFAAERPAEIRHEKAATWRLMLDGRVLTYGLAFFGVLCGSYGLTLWLPQMVHAFGASSLGTGLITAIPFVFGCVATVILARSSDRSGERTWHVAGPALCSAVGLALATLTASPVVIMAAISMAAVGIFGLRGTFFALLSEEFSDADSAIGIAAVGAYSSLAGLIGPWVVGLLKEATGRFDAGMLFLSLMSLMSAVIVLMRSRHVRRARRSVVSLTP